MAIEDARVLFQSEEMGVEDGKVYQSVSPQ